ncbi:hypothetical protein QAD02_012933 [Eretmocerus hayati]|uniref:Uncharacterized protein n=1 Tax=Eretmocerus hayati TaxID=131215 RepID=A0ACC2P261_9HYME|nr:hypothetical protein QAD02_012933 [Eretmocerus hayati]
MTSSPESVAEFEMDQGSLNEELQRGFDVTLYTEFTWKAISDFPLSQKCGGQTVMLNVVDDVITITTPDGFVYEMENPPPVDNDSENEDLLELEVRDEDEFGDIETGAGEELEINPVVENLGAVVDAEESRADEIAGDRRDDRIADLQKSVDQLSSQVASVMSITKRSLETNMKSRSDILKDLSVHTAQIKDLATIVKSNAERIKVVSDKCDSMSASLGSGAGTARSGLENVCTDGSSVRTTPQRTIEVPSTSGTRSVVSQTPSLTDDRRDTDTEVVDSLVSSEFLKPPKFTRCYKLGETSQWTFFIDKFISELVTRGCRAIDKQLNLLCPVSESVEHVIRDTLIQHIEECYYVQIQHLDKPMDMLLRLRKLKAAEVLKDADTIKREIFSLRYDRRQDPPLKFIEKFDTLIREYNQVAESGRLSDQEIAGASYATVKRCCTGLQTLQYVTMVDQEKRGEQKTGMPLDELKKIFWTTKPQDNRLPVTPSLRLRWQPQTCFIKTNQETVIAIIVKTIGQIISLLIVLGKEKGLRGASIAIILPTIRLETVLDQQRLLK